VSNIIKTFTAYISKFDRDIRYIEFSNFLSTVRIIVVTILLRMGINIKDIKRVTIWDFPLRRDLGNI
jgi:hypothetical protein